MNLKRDLAVFGYYLLIFLVVYTLSGLFFVFLVRPLQWWLMTDISYEKPTIDFLIRCVKALGVGAFISALGMFVYQKMQSR